MLRPATPEDAAAIADIYAPYVTASAISFETNPPDASAMRSRIEACGDLYPWLVATDESRAVLGYASASAYRPRSEEHTSELQSLMRTSYAVLWLKKTTHPNTPTLSPPQIPKRTDMPT